MNDIFTDANKKKSLTNHDMPKIKHDCIMLYGFDWWCSVGLEEVFEQYPLIQKELNNRKRNDEVQERLCGQVR